MCTYGAGEFGALLTWKRCPWCIVTTACQIIKAKWEALGVMVTGGHTHLRAKALLN